MKNATAIRTPNRGRPSANLQRHVVDDLMRATEDALDRKSAREITVREISTAAGTSEAMIRYYFGGKEGLLLEVINEFMKKSPHKDFEKISDLCIEARSLYPLAEILFDFHYSNPTIIKTITVELFSSPSEFNTIFQKKYGRCVNHLIENVIDRLKEANIYRSDVNTAFVAMMLLRLIVAPIMESAVTGSSMKAPEVANGEWARFIVQSIDQIAK